MVRDGGSCPSSRIVVSCHLRKSTVRLTICFVSFTSKKSNNQLFFIAHPRPLALWTGFVAKKHFPFLKRKILIGDIASPITNAPQKSGSMSDVATSAYCVIRRVVRRIADNPLQRTIMLKDISATKRTQVTRSGVLSSFFFCCREEMGCEPHELRSLTRFCGVPLALT